MANRVPFSLDEWYHCYNRGVDKRHVFRGDRDYRRFMALLFAANGEVPVHISNLKDTRFSQIIEQLKTERGVPLVDIGAYCLMPNHVHLVMKEIRPNGIATFMQKVFTGYTMYFNKKNERTGALFAGTFKSKHLHDDAYCKHAVTYVHLNPGELLDSAWETGMADIPTLTQKMVTYPYSSVQDFHGLASRPEKSILGASIFDLYEQIPELTTAISDALAYNAEKYQG